MADAVGERSGTVGVILRDAAGVFYAITDEGLAALRVTEEQRPLVEALIRGEDLAGFGPGWDGPGAFATLCRALQEIGGAWAPSVHLTHVAASLWVIAR